MLGCNAGRAHLPELLASILSADSLQYLRSTWVLVYKATHLIYAIVDDDVETLLDCVVLGDFFRCEALRHYCGGDGWMPRKVRRTPIVGLLGRAQRKR